MLETISTLLSKESAIFLSDMTKCNLIVNSNGITKQVYPSSLGIYSIDQESNGRQSYKHISRDIFLHWDKNDNRIRIVSAANKSYI